MNPYKYNVIFRLEKRPDASGDYPINADITFGGKRIFFFTGCKVDESQWNKTTQQMKRNNFNRSGVSATDINNRLIKIRAAIDSVFADFEHKEIVATPKSLREAIRKELDEEKTARMTIAECYQLLIDEREKELKERPATAQWTLSTLKKHKTMLRHFNDFNKTLYFEDLTQALLLEFEVFLISKGLSNGYVAKSLVDVKTFLNWATAQGYNTSTAYKGFTGKFKDETKNGSLDDHFALNQEELTEVINVQTPSSAIARTRDMFVFSCFTGLRYSDVVKVRWNDISDDGVDVVAQKTRQHIRIPLNNTLRSILARYVGVCEDGLVFPKISNQKYNQQLKTLGQLAGLTDEWIKVTQVGNTITKTPMKKWECLSSHVARRTFVSYALSCGLQPETIRAITGHTTSEMMQKYVKFDQTTKQRFMDKLDSEEAPQCKAKQITNVFDYAETDNDTLLIRRMLNLPDRDKYLRKVDKEPMLAVLHLAVFLWNTQSAVAAAPYIDRLPSEYLDQFYYLMATTRQYKQQG